MVGLVLVSHSRNLAESLLSLIRQVCPKPIPVRVAAGVGDNHQETGTDAVEIENAIREVFGPEGVLVLMDLGSAILSAETALELLPEEWKSSVRLCPAPLVEGALSAAVQIAAGQTLDSVCREACRALLQKQEQITSAPAEPFFPEGSGIEARGTELLFTLKEPHGLHARPAARLVQLISRFRADIYVRRPDAPGRGVASGRSLTSLITLGVRQGDVAAISASGEEAEQALAAVREFFIAGLAEEVLAATAGEMRPEMARSCRALPLSPGVAWGPVCVFDQASEIGNGSSGEPEAEWTRFETAVGAAKEAIRSRTEALATSAPDQAEILETQLLTLEDPVILARVRESVFESREGAEKAWTDAVDKVVASYEGLEDPYLRQRAADLRDIRASVRRALSTKQDPRAGFYEAVTQPVVVIARELSPGLIAGLPRHFLLGAVTVEGQRTSHGAIMARSLRVPAVSGIPASFLSLTSGATVALDGATGEVWVDPDAGTVQELSRRQGTIGSTRHTPRRSPCQTRDGVRVQIAANVGSVEGARVASDEQAEAVGVLRTEFMYLNRIEPPSEQEQLATLEEIGAAIAGRAVWVRTLDAGGDKPLAFLPHAAEQNPYLGVRGLRLSLREVSVFRTQVRAVLRAAARYDLRLMFPMVSTVEDVLQARSFLDQVHNELTEQGINHRWPILLAVMIETPSAALLASSLAPLVDFLSIGTNDLTQYTLAAERGHPQLGEYLDALHPAVLRLIAETVECGHRAGKRVAVCGEVASDPIAVPVLVGLGVDELSVNPAAVALIYETVRHLSAQEARNWALGVLKLKTAKEVREASTKL